MKQYAWAILALGLWGAGVGVNPARGQEAPAPVQLKQNYPNPSNPATTIPFALSGELFANGHRPKVSLKVYNVLAQLVAIPILQGSGDSLDNLELPCADTAGCAFNAYWDGNVWRTGQRAASGVYLYQLVVDGTRYTKKMVVMR